MHDPYILLTRVGPFDLWHRDKGGRDGACGWFMRAHHGSPETLRKIESRFEMEWDRTIQIHEGTHSPPGLFDCSPFGWPIMSIHAIALNLFFWAAFEHCGCNRDRAMKFMRKNLCEILLFAENPTDSAVHGWLHRYGIDERETCEERIHKAAVMIYGWVLRETRPWYRHPRWHVSHWRITCRWMPKLSRRILADCPTAPTTGLRR